jgi:hypothetical protein
MHRIFACSTTHLELPQEPTIETRNNSNEGYDGAAGPDLTSSSEDIVWGHRPFLITVNPVTKRYWWGQQLRSGTPGSSCWTRRVFWSPKYEIPKSIIPPSLVVPFFRRFQILNFRFKNLEFVGSASVATADLSHKTNTPSTSFANAQWGVHRFGVASTATSARC